MWVFDIFPAWIAHIVFTAGVLGIIISFFGNLLPVIRPYTLAIQLISTILIGVSVYWYGGLNERQEWEAKVASLEKRVSEAEKKAAETNTHIVTKYITKTKKIQGKRDEIIKYVDREIVKYDSQCVIPKEVIDVMNKATEVTE